MGRSKLIRLILTAVFMVTGFSAAVMTPEAGATTYPWLSWRHDLQNTGAAPDSGYPTAAQVLWDKTRGNEPPLGTPARCTTPVVVGNDLVIATGNGGVVEARNQRTGNLVWSKTYMWITPAGRACQIRRRTGAKAQRLTWTKPGRMRIQNKRYVS